MPHSPCMCEGTGNLPSERRDARVVEWTALEMRHTGDCIQGSNPCLSALSAQRLASCNPLCRFFLWSHVPSVTGFWAQWKFVGEGFFRKLRAVGDLLTAEAPHTPHLRREMIVQTGNFFSTGSSRPLSHQKKRKSLIRSIWGNNMSRSNNTCGSKEAEKSASQIRHVFPYKIPLS